jgi:agmatine/peptidylarginine deiminase
MEGFSVQGYYEASTPEALEPFRGKVKAIPEYHNVTRVVISEEQIRERHRSEEPSDKKFAEDIQKVFRTIGTPLLSLPFTIGSGDEEMWVRDWAPVTVTNGNEKIFVEFNYYTDRPTADALPRKLAGMTGRRILSLPFQMEAGNFMINDDGLCLTTKQVGKNNKDFEARYPQSRAVPIGDNYKVIEEYFRDFLGCKKTVFFDVLDSTGKIERTGRIDIWAKFISNDKVLVGQIDTNKIYPSEVSDAISWTDTKRFAAQLDEFSRQISSLGLKVIRLPMPPVLKPARDSIVADTLAATHTNFLLVNGHALVPSYSDMFVMFPNFSGTRPKGLDKLFLDLEKDVKSIVTNLGMNVHFIESSSKIARQGAVHCLTMQIH